RRNVDCAEAMPSDNSRDYAVVVTAQQQAWSHWMQNEVNISVTTQPSLGRRDRGRNQTSVPATCRARTETRPHRNVGAVCGAARQQVPARPHHHRYGRRAGRSGFRRRAAPAGSVAWTPAGRRELTGLSARGCKIARSTLSVAGREIELPAPTFPCYSDV